MALVRLPWIGGITREHFVREVPSEVLADEKTRKKYPTGHLHNRDRRTEDFNPQNFGPPPPHKFLGAYWKQARLSRRKRKSENVTDMIILVSTRKIILQVETESLGASVVAEKGGWIDSRHGKIFSPHIQISMLKKVQYVDPVFGSCLLSPGLD